MHAALTAAGLQPQVGPTSTTIMGEATVVCAALQGALGCAVAMGQVVMTVTLSNACPAVPLLQCVMWAGQAVQPLTDLAAARQRHADDMAHLAAPYLQLRAEEEYPVRLSPGLAALQHQVETSLRQQGQEASMTPEWATHD